MNEHCVRSHSSTMPRLQISDTCSNGRGFFSNSLLLLLVMLLPLACNLCHGTLALQPTTPTAATDVPVLELTIQSPAYLKGTLHLAQNDPHPCQTLLNHIRSVAGTAVPRQELQAVHTVIHIVRSWLEQDNNGVIHDAQHNQQPQQPNKRDTFTMPQLPEDECAAFVLYEDEDRREDGENRMNADIGVRIIVVEALDQASAVGQEEVGSDSYRRTTIPEQAQNDQNEPKKQGMHITVDATGRLAHAGAGIVGDGEEALSVAGDGVKTMADVQKLVAHSISYDGADAYLDLAAAKVHDADGNELVHPQQLAQEYQSLRQAQLQTPLTVLEVNEWGEKQREDDALLWEKRRAHLDEFGFVTVPIFTSHELAKMRRIFQAYKDLPGGLITGCKPDFINHPMFFDLIDLPKHPRIMYVMRQLFNSPDFRFCHQADVSYNRIVPWHKDRLNGAQREFEVHDPWEQLSDGTSMKVYKILTYMQSHDDDDHALQVVPGSHKSSRLYMEYPKEWTVQVQPRAGESLIIDQRISHRGMHRTDVKLNKTRILMQLGYGANNVFTDEFERGTIHRQARQNTYIRQRLREKLQKQRQVT